MNYGGKKNSMLEVEIQFGLPHASHCTITNCPSKACGRLKKLIDHEPMCEIKLDGGCKTCNEYWDLVVSHAKQCKSRECEVVHCDELKPAPILKKSSLLQSALSMITRRPKSPTCESNEPQGSMRLGNNDTDDDDDDD